MVVKRAQFAIFLALFSMSTALSADEGELLPAYKMLAEVTATCVACHSAYRIK